MFIDSDNNKGKGNGNIFEAIISLFKYLIKTFIASVKSVVYEVNNDGSSKDKGKSRFKCSSKKVTTSSSRLTELLNSPFMNLSNVYRFSNTKLIERESTSMHTVDMQLIALYLYNRVPIFDIENTIYRILMHDMDECVLCDIPRDIKYHDSRSQNIINSIGKDKLQKAGISNKLISDIDKAKYDGSREAYIVSIIDVLQCSLKLLNELRLQANSVILSRYIESLKTCKDIIGKYKTEYMASLKNVIHVDRDTMIVHEKLYKEFIGIWKDLSMIGNEYSNIVKI